MADTGTHRPVSYTMHDGVTTIPLRMLPRDAMFIVFDKPATEMARVIPDPIPTQVTELARQWQVAFQPDHGGPGVATFPELTDWTESTDPGIKYYSGTAICLIGDQQPGAKKIAFAPNSLYKSNSPLLPSGLQGPVVDDKITAVEPGTLPE
jgi:hypothetical protein